MTLTAALSTVALTVVLLVSGVAKVLDLKGTRQALEAFGVPSRFALTFAPALAVAEVVLAIALLIPPVTQWAAVGSALLFLVFILGISVNLARGRTPDCHCFGQLYSKPISRKTLVRNVALLGAAVFVAWQSGNTSDLLSLWASALSWQAWAGLSVAVLGTGALAFLSWLTFSLWAQQGRLLARIEQLEQGQAKPTAPAKPQRADLPIGTLAPAFTLPNVGGQTISLGQLIARAGPSLLLFIDPQCGPCTALLPQVGTWQRDYQGILNFTVISRGDPSLNLKQAEKHGLGSFLLQDNREVAEAFKVRATPSAVLVRPDGSIGSTVVEGSQAISALVSSVAGHQVQFVETDKTEPSVTSKPRLSVPVGSRL